MNAVVRRDTQFSAIRADAGRPKSLAINPKEERITTVLAADASIEGNLRFTNGVKIDGHVQGNIVFGTDDGLCIVSKGAVVEGDLRGPKALILGEVQGNLEIEGLLLLAPSAVVVGTVKSGRMVMYDGASVTGTMETVRPQPEANAEQNFEVTAKEREVLPFRKRILG